MKHKQILSSIVKVSEQCFHETDINKSMKLFLDELLSLTDSEYGFIGIIEENKEQKFLKTLAITDISWNEQTKKFYHENETKGLEFYNLQSLFGDVINHNHVVISNKAENDKRACGVPPGHPPLKRFLGIPFNVGDNFVAMCGVANRIEEYTTKMVKDLEPICNFIASIIYNDSLKKNQAGLKNDIRKNLSIIDSIFKTSPEAIVSINTKGIIQSASESALKLFGYKENEFLGQNIKIIVNKDHQSKHDSYLKNYLKTGKTTVINSIREIDAVKKDGSLFPIELSVSAIEMGNIGFLGIIRDLSYQKKYQESLKQAQKAAQEHNLAKSEFLAIMSHELRTPMNGILGALQILMLEEEHDPIINTAYEQSQSLMGSLNTILDYSRLKVGLYDIDEKPFSLRSLLYEVNDLVARRALNKGLQFDIDCDEEEGLRLISDPYRIKQILLNLLDNAIKFTQQGSISLRTKLERIDDETAYCIFKVKDSGCGIPDGKIESIFNDFSQVDTSTTRESTGFGLGLSISLQIAEILDAKLSVDSVEGKGTTITFSLPLKVKKKAAKTSINLNSATKVLIVEDNVVNYKVLSAMLKKHDLKADIAENGQIALDMYESGKYKVIFMDLMMPVMNGYDCAINIRKVDKDIPIITVSANNDAIQVKKSRECGMNDFISKPISREKLESLIYKYNLLDK